MILLAFVKNCILVEYTEIIIYKFIILYHILVYREQPKSLLEDSSQSNILLLFKKHMRYR